MYRAACKIRPLLSPYRLKVLPISECPRASANCCQCAWRRGLTHQNHFTQRHQRRKSDDSMTRHSTTPDTFVQTARQISPLSTLSATAREDTRAKNYSHHQLVPNLHRTSTASLPAMQRDHPLHKEDLANGKVIKGSLQPHRHLKTRDCIVSLTERDA